MYKQVSFVITASIILTAFLTIAVYTGSEAHAQAAGANATAAGNMTKSTNATAAGANATAAGANATAAGNMTKSTNATAAGNMTQPLVSANASKHQHLSTGYGVQG
jgi:long-subunit fatty acid transport protein